MSLVRRSTRFVIVFLIFTSIACGEPPDKELQQAQGAIDAARAAGADQYAHEEFVAAQQALQRSNEAVEQRDYRLALNHALDSRERAQNASKMAADGKAAARVEADRAIAASSDALDSLRAAVTSAESSRSSARLVASARKVVATAERQVQEARTAYDRGDFLRAATMAHDATGPVTVASREFPSAPPPPARRRR